MFSCHIVVRIYSTANQNFATNDSDISRENLKCLGYFQHRRKVLSRKFITVAELQASWLFETYPDINAGRQA